MNAGSLRSAAHHASPSGRSSAILPIRCSYGAARGAQHEPTPVVLDQVDEAGVDATPFREQLDDGAEHLVELEARADRRDDPCQHMSCCPARRRSRPAS